MLWTSINLKLRHLWKIIFTYTAYESNTSVLVNTLNYVTFFIALLSLSFFL